MKTISMKMCRPKKEDGDAAATIMGILMDVNNGEYPRKADGECDQDAPDYFDQTDGEHLKVFHDRLMTVMNSAPGGLLRVIGGMVFCVMYEENQIIDPDSDTLDLHPRIKKALQSQETE